MKKLYIIFLILVINCSSPSDKQNILISDKWISKKAPRCDIWFQNWVEYDRLFITYYQDTLQVNPSPYLVESKEKPYLRPRPKKVITKQQLIGNITWRNTPSWKNGVVNQFEWIIDRANPKKVLPKKYQGSMVMDDSVLKIEIEYFGKQYLSMTAEPILYK